MIPVTWTRDSLASVASAGTAAGAQAPVSSWRTALHHCTVGRQYPPPPIFQWGNTNGCYCSKSSQHLQLCWFLVWFHIWKQKGADLKSRKNGLLFPQASGASVRAAMPNPASGNHSRTSASDTHEAGISAALGNGISCKPQCLNLYVSALDPPELLLPILPVPPSPGNTAHSSVTVSRCLQKQVLLA